MECFQMERMQSTWENLVEFDLSESGVLPATLREIVEIGFDLEAALDVPLGYSQGDGTPELKEHLARIYPGAKPGNIEVTNGTSEANYLVALSQLRQGDEFAFQIPNYMQLWGVPPAFGAKVNTFTLRQERDWEPDWDEFERAVNPKTRMVYVSNPNNPTGSILSEEAMRRIVRRCEEMDAWLLSDEVYLGSEIRGDRTRSFWGMSDKVVVTSGLSKAYGLPGIRIGWIIGPEDVITECWTQHDYITICPNKLSDIMARVVVREDNREKLYARTRRILQENLAVFTEWVEGLGDGYAFRPPQAGAIAFLKYEASLPSAEICERLRVNQSTLIVPGSYLGLEGYLRFWLGGSPGFMTEGLGRVKAELGRILSS